MFYTILIAKLILHISRLCNKQQLNSLTSNGKIQQISQEKRANFETENKTI
jgi:hypothetical protein